MSHPVDEVIDLAEATAGDDGGAAPVIEAQVTDVTEMAVEENTAEPVPAPKKRTSRTRKSAGGNDSKKPASRKKKVT